MTAVNNTKGEHYVPKFYLCGWENEKNHIYVYDKKNRKKWPSNKGDIANERYFYDIPATELTQSTIDFLHENNIYPENDKQFIEHFFGKEIENKIAPIIKKIIEKEPTTFEKQKRKFITNTEKFMLSIYIAYQFIRTKSVRNRIIDISSCFEQFAKNENCSTSLVKQLASKPGEEKKIQSNLFFDINFISDMAKSFLNLTWMLGLNETGIPLYTSDNPIGLYPHVYNGDIAMCGPSSEGIEIYFPLSPKHILIMVDSKYYKSLSKYEKKYKVLDSAEIIERYNTLCICNSEQYVYLNNDDYSFIDTILDENPQIISAPKVSMSFNDREYYPK